MHLARIIKKTLSKPLAPLWACTFIDILGYSMMMPYFPQFLMQMDVPLALVGIIFSISPLIGFFTNILWGSLADRFGRKPIMIIGRIGSLAGYLLLAFSSNLPMLILSRVVGGIFSLTVPIALTIVGDSVSPDKRSMEMSNVGAAWIVGGLIGPGLGAILAENGVLGMGLFNAVLMLVTILITIYGVQESHPYRVGRGILDGVGDGKQVLSLAVLKQPSARLLLIQSLINKIPYFMFATTTSIYMTVRFGFSIAQIGTLLTIASSINLFVRLFLFPRILRKLGDERTLRFGFFLYLGAFVWLIFAGQVWEFFMIILLMSLASSCSLDVMSSVMSKVVKENELGEMMGLNSAAESFALVVGPIIGSSLLGSPVSMFYGMTAAGLSIIPLALEYHPLKRTSSGD